MKCVFFELDRSPPRNVTTGICNASGYGVVCNGIQGGHCQKLVLERIDKYKQSITTLTERVEDLEAKQCVYNRG